MKKIYKHNYNEGDIIVDIEHKEMFAFKDRQDGFKAQNKPETLRLANEEEIKLFESSGSDCYKFSGEELKEVV